MEHAFDELSRRTLELAAWLVAQPSVTYTAGEVEIADLLEQHLRSSLPEYATVQRIAVPPVAQEGRSALIAWLPAAQPTTQCVALLGHFDTVGVADYGALTAHAYDSEALKAVYATHADPAAAAAAQSHDWAFGRGWLDMKGGVAALCEAFIAEAGERRLPYHLALLLVPDEESESAGVRAVQPALQTLLRDAGATLRQVLCADYAASDAPEPTAVLHTGTIGKLLLGVSVFGTTTHAAEPVAGANSAALAAHLAAGLEHSRALQQRSGAYWLPPPTVLHVAARRESYDVATPQCSELYVNLFHAGGEPGVLWRAVLSELRSLCREWDVRQRRSYQRFRARSNTSPPRASTRARVTDYARLAALVEQTEPVHDGELDPRLAAFGHIRALHDRLPPRDHPLVVASVLLPFYPAYSAPRADADASALREYARTAGLRVEPLYPYISDKSFFAWDASVAGWQRNAPRWYGEGELAVRAALAAPVANLGPIGAGAHSPWERVYLPALARLPGQIIEALGVLRHR